MFGVSGAAATTMHHEDAVRAPVGSPVVTPVHSTQEPPYGTLHILVLSGVERLGMAKFSHESTAIHSFRVRPAAGSSGTQPRVTPYFAGKVINDKYRLVDLIGEGG